MPTAKLSAARFLDHGIIAAPVAARDFSDDAPELSAASVSSPGETSALVMASAKKVALSGGDRALAPLAKAILAARNPAQLAAAVIKARYDQLGGARGFLGAAQNAVSPCPDGVGFFQHFAGGSIYWSPSSGAHEVHGLIRAKWAALGWERSFLGYPTTSETPGRDVRHEGRFNHFTGGSLFWHPQLGTFEVHGAIRQKYLELGGEASFLGYPTTDETICPDRVGRFNHFQAGSIYWTSGTGAHEVHGLIRQKWAELGWERNAALGYPITDELIPSRTVGSVRVPPIRKPIGTLGLDVLRVPDEQPSPTIVTVPTGVTLTQPSRVSSGLRVMAVTPAPQPVHATVTRASSSPATTATAVVGPIFPAGGLSVALPVARQKHTGESRDRFADFQSGVMFWRRGAPQAQVLNPSGRAPDGSKLVWTAAEVAALAATPIRAALQGLGGAAVTSVTFVGTTGYSYDGAGVHNRAHRLHVMLQGMRMVGLVPSPAIATVEIRTVISFDPVDREVVGYLTKWSLVASPGDFLGGGSLPRGLATRLDPVLWRQFSVTHIPADPADLVAVLSVKTQADGQVAVYLEP
jgi:hypothetical protein